MRILLSIFVCLIAGFVVSQTIDLGDPGFLARLNRPASSSFTANTAVFDGSADYMTNFTALTGVADGKAATIAFWLKSGADGTSQVVFVISNTDTSQNRFFVLKNVDNTIRIVGRTGGATTVLDATSSLTITTASGWVHVLINFDTTDTLKRHFYFSGTEDASVTWTTYDSSNPIDLSAATPRCAVGAAVDGTSKASVSLAELWFEDSFYNTLSTFISGGKPVDLLGTTSALYLSQNGSGNSWNVDSSGNLNNFTVVGSLGTDTSP